MTAYQIDWKREFATLEPCFSSGGVVRIYCPGEACAANNFALVLKRRFAESSADGQGANSQRRSIRRDPDWHSTHTLDDKLTALDDKLAASGYPATAADRAMTGPSILSDMSAEGDIHIAVHNSNLGGNYHTAAQRRVRLDDICARLRRLLDEDGRVLLISNDQALRDQTPFWTDLWDRGLGDLTDAGLLLIDMIGPMAGGRPHERAPVPDQEFTLPMSFDADQQREFDAYDDLVEIFVSAGLSDDAALAYLSSNKHSVAAVHDRLAGVWMALKQRRNRRNG